MTIKAIIYEVKFGESTSNARHLNTKISVLKSVKMKIVLLLPSFNDNNTVWFVLVLAP
jgi:hypothetical protein